MIESVDAIDQLWAVATRAGPVDVNHLLATLTQLSNADVARADVRTRLLARDAAAALRNYGDSRWQRDHAAALQRIPSITKVPDDVGFPTLRYCLVEPTNPGALFDLLRDLGRRVHTPSKIVIGGSLALMVDELIVRRTEDVDVVDELPEAIRGEHALLHDLAIRYRLQLTHFQSHYLNDGWRSRVRSLGVFGSITAFRVDPIDVLVGKLFSRRDKDLDDVRLALPLVDRQTFIDRLATTTARWRADAELLAAATSNWYVITGENSLPPAR